MTTTKGGQCYEKGDFGFLVGGFDSKLRIPWGHYSKRSYRLGIDFMIHKGYWQEGDDNPYPRPVFFRLMLWKWEIGIEWWPERSDR
jgi:hypothetical protein